ncbi:MAG: hypothetical protein ACRBK7_26330 [Acidimicrobiales bacterium]
MTVQLDGKPLRHTFVSYTPDFENPQIALTDGDGQVKLEGVGRNAKVDIIVHAHNLAIRMLDGTNPSISEMSLRFRNKGDGDKLNITRRNKRHFDHYLIMDRCYEVYETVFRPIPPFSGASHREYPYGRSGSASDEHRRTPSVDCRFPETLAPGKLPWVQPRSLLTGVPLMHLKPQSIDARLFGSATKKPTFIPHEFAHAIHFAKLSKFTRLELAFRYGRWIVKELAKGNAATHRTNKATDPLIAYVEALGIFSQRFWFFATEVRPDLTGSRLRAAFVEDELSKQPSLKKVLPGYVPIATRAPDGTIKPRLTGDKTEGAVYGAIFLDFASRTSLSTAVSMFIKSGALDFDEYRKYGSGRSKGKYRQDLTAVAKTWKM